jgi:hypothetical protein
MTAAKASAIRLAELALGVLVFACSLLLAATPLGFLWLLSSLDITAVEFYVAALFGCPMTLVLAGWLLLRVNDLYRRAAGTESRALLEASVTLSVLIAFAAITVWFFSGEGGTHLGP